jgi:hypothetical protein
MTTTKLSPQMQQILANALSFGWQRPPFAAGRRASAIASAWHRSVRALLKRGLVEWCSSNPNDTAHAIRLTAAGMNQTMPG